MTTAVRPQPMTRDRAEQLIDRVGLAGDLLGKAFAREVELQDLKGLKKAEAIHRLIGTPNQLTQKPHSASSAADVVEQDQEYFTFLRDCRAAIAERYEAHANYECARLRAQLAVQLTAAKEI